MTQPLVFTFVGADRPGLVEQLSQTVAEHGGNWLESRMREMDTSLTHAPMSGDPLFEAVAQIQVPQALDLDALKAQLNAVADTLTVDIDLEESLR